MFKSVMIRGVLACQAGGRLLLFSCPYLYVLSVFDAAIPSKSNIVFAFIRFLREAVSDKTARAIGQTARAAWEAGKQTPCSERQ